MDGLIKNTHAYVQPSRSCEEPFWVILPINALRYVLRRGVFGYVGYSDSDG